MWTKIFIPTTSLDDIGMLEKHKRLMWKRYLDGKLPGGKEILNLIQEVINNEKKSFSDGEGQSFYKYESPNDGEENIQQTIS